MLHSGELKDRHLAGFSVCPEMTAWAGLISGVSMRRFFLPLFALAAFFFAQVCHAAEKSLKVGLIYESPADDGGWSHSHDQARQALAKLPGVTTVAAESVPKGKVSESIIEDMVRQGCDIVFITSFEYLEPTMSVAKRYPGTVFMHCAGIRTAANVGNYYGRMYEARYLTGMVAGAMTRTGVAGWVAAYPSPEVLRGLNAFALGVQAMNPKAEVHVMWTRTSYGPDEAKEAARKLVAGGADVIAQHQDSPAAQQAAEEMGVYSVGYSSDMSAFAPRAHLVAAVWDWTSFYTKTLSDVRAGTWRPASFWPGMESGIVALSPFGPMVPQRVRERVLESRDAIIRGDLVIFKGPLRDSNGRLRYPEGVVLTDKELLTMDWFAQGVVEKD